MKQSILTKSQAKTVTLLNKEHPEYGLCDLIIDIRYDDSCGNGHNSFSITGTLYEAGRPGHRGIITCGCIHEDIKLLAPEYSHLIRWDFMSSDTPIHYLANTLYHAKDKECMSSALGAVLKTRRKVQMHNVSVFPNNNREMLKCTDLINSEQVQVVVVKHDDTTGYQYADKYKVQGINDSTAYKWYQGEFDNLSDAENYIQAVCDGHVDIAIIPTAWNTAIKPNLEAARSSACWPDATLEQLQDKELLEGRIPSLQAEFAKVVEELGFVY